VTVVDTGPTTDAAAAAEEQRRSSHQPSSVEALRVEPLLGLEWSQAIEQWGGEQDATTPAETRRSWLHRAPEPQVLALYRAIQETDPAAPAPWWLRALEAGTLSSRLEGFKVEDRVSKLLAARTGWVYVPWGADGDSGFWEYVPSERKLTEPGVPTTLMLTDRHTGWIDVIRVHPSEANPAPIAVAGLADLRANLARVESLAP
jgi:hypothetical protein